MKVLRYSRQATPKNLLLLKTSPIFLSPLPIIFYTGAVVAVAAPHLWFGLPLCDLSITS